MLKLKLINTWTPGHCSWRHLLWTTSFQSKKYHPCGGTRNRNFLLKPKANPRSTSFVCVCQKLTQEYGHNWGSASRPITLPCKFSQRQIAVFLTTISGTECLCLIVNVIAFASFHFLWWARGGPYCPYVCFSETAVHHHPEMFGSVYLCGCVWTQR